MMQVPLIMASWWRQVAEALLRRSYTAAPVAVKLYRNISISQVL
jgi:hypothetical protein